MPEPFTSLNSLSSKFSDLKVIAGGGSGIVLSGIDKSLSESSLHDKDGSAVALKRLSLVGKGHCRVALRELRLLKRFTHENVVKTYKITDSNGSIIDDHPTVENFKDLDSVYVVEELLDTDLHKVIERNGKLSLDTSKLFLYQLLRGLKYIHSANVMHRDIKPGNLFVNVDDLSLKIGDYGLARVFDKRYEHGGYLTAVVSTRYYRAPEVMKNLGDYSYPIDVWSCGCVFAEMLLGKILFSGENDLDQFNVICSAFGLTSETIYTEKNVFPEQLFEGVDTEAIDLLSQMLCIDPSERITIAEALTHPFFADLHDPFDEPSCDYPFQIEHEIDNLPVKILKRKILRNSCVNNTMYEKKSYHSSEENLFKDFDEDFSCYCPTSSMTESRKNGRNTRKNHLKVSTFNSHGEETWSSNTNSSVESPPPMYNNYHHNHYHNHHNINQHTTSKSQKSKTPTSSTNSIIEEIPSITNSIVSSNTTSIDDTASDSDSFIPSLRDAMDYCQVLIDEPFRDPGVCVRKYHNDVIPSSYDDAPVKSSFLTPSDPCDADATSYFSGLSPVIDMSEPSFNIPYASTAAANNRKTRASTVTASSCNKNQSSHDRNNNDDKIKSVDNDECYQIGEAPFLGDRGRSCAINIGKSSTVKRQSQSRVSTVSTTTFTELKFESSTPTNCKSVEELRSLNCDILRTLNERSTASKCNLQMMLTDKFTKQSQHFSHWDSLKLWI